MSPQWMGRNQRTSLECYRTPLDQTKSFYGNDVKTTYQLISWILHYESQQQGFNLAAMRDAKFNEVGFTPPSLLSI